MVFKGTTVVFEYIKTIQHGVGLLQPHTAK